MDVEKFLGKEVFVLAPDGSSEETHTIHIFEKEEELAGHLIGLQANIDQTDLADIKLVHGFLTASDVLPSTYGNTTVFLLILDPYDDDAGIIIESSADEPSTLGDEIEDMIAHAGGTYTAYSPDLSDLEIDHVCVLYGYEIEIRYAIDRDELNVITINECEDIAEEVNLIRKRSKKQIAELSE